MDHFIDMGASHCVLFLSQTKLKKRQKPIAIKVPQKPPGRLSGKRDQIKPNTSRRIQTQKLTKKYGTTFANSSCVKKATEVFGFQGQQHLDPLFSISGSFCQQTTGSSTEPIRHS